MDQISRTEGAESLASTLKNKHNIRPTDVFVSKTFVVKSYSLTNHKLISIYFIHSTSRIIPLFWLWVMSCITCTQGTFNNVTAVCLWDYFANPQHNELLAARLCLIPSIRVDCFQLFSSSPTSKIRKTWRSSIETNWVADKITNKQIENNREASKPKMFRCTILWNHMFIPTTVEWKLCDEIKAATSHGSVKLADM